MDTMSLCDCEIVCGEFCLVCISWKLSIQHFKYEILKCRWINAFARPSCTNAKTNKQTNKKTTTKEINKNGTCTYKKKKKKKTRINRFPAQNCFPLLYPVDRFFNSNDDDDANDDDSKKQTNTHSHANAEITNQVTVRSDLCIYAHLFRAIL